ncbi:MAG: hypothetical protein DCC58_20880 [Chloroflexi bacterium]|nr:MAG: hypothetical protein DCC58_20880 [Chloroflexota bacterium]
MELSAEECGLLETYMARFTSLAGDQRSAHLLTETVRGILGSASLCCARIARFSPDARRWALWRDPHSAHAAR